MIEIDGSQGEGGGQVLRAALALSVLTGQAFVIDRIRARRPKPGLMRQHLACVQAAAAISGAQLEGAALGSARVAFAPQALRAGDYAFEVASAGSCMLVLQTVLPPLLLADGPSTLQLSGGTHNPMAPSFHFLRDAYAPLVARMGAQLQLNLRRHGFYPAGGGRVQARIEPVAGRLRAFDVSERGALREGHALCLAPGLPGHVRQRELQVLQAGMGWRDEQMQHGSARQNEGPGNALLLTLAYEQVTEVFAEYGAPGLSAEEVARRLLQQVRAYQASGAPVGPHLADQLALLLALAVWHGGGQAAFVCSEVTEHLRTHVRVIERFLPVAFALTPEGPRTRVQVSAAA